MSGLLSMLVPWFTYAPTALETLPGWPVAPPVNPLAVLGLLFGLPVVAIILISLIGQVGHKAAVSRGTAREPDGLLSRPEQDALGGDSDRDRGEITSGDDSAGPARTGHDDVAGAARH